MEVQERRKEEVEKGGGMEERRSEGDGGVAGGERHKVRSRCANEVAW